MMLREGCFDKLVLKSDKWMNSEIQQVFVFRGVKDEQQQEEEGREMNPSNRYNTCLLQIGKC